MKKKNQKGFTLVELLVVIAIIGILAIVAVPALFKNINKAKVADLKADYNAFKSASLSYYTDKNTYPITLTGTGDTDLDEYMEKVPMESPFKSKYIYEPVAKEASMIITTTLDNGISTELKDIIEKDANDQIKIEGNKITMIIISNTTGLTTPSTN
jgi:prepilin-type N-terminal cleavage/methylation domain-containing protein